MNSGKAAENGSVARVLIVDDNSDAAKTTGMWLELTGHDVDVVVDASECLSHLEAFNPDIVLLDIAMPGISGYDLAKKIRLNPRFENLPIIAISGFADQGHAQMSMAAGCNQHLAKPVDLHALKDVIAEKVQNRIQLPGGKGA
ncbi:MAG TPA: response regulator [Pirellulales bacterium]|nr:response regulator [Pirellulales bacterium]